MANPTVVQAGDCKLSYASGSACSPFGREGAGGVNTTVGNAVILFVYCSPGEPVVSVTSGVGTFGFLGRVAAESTTNPFGSGTSDVEVWACQSVTGAANTVTVTTTGANIYTASAYEIASAGSIVMGPSNSGASGTSATLAFTGLTIGSLCVGLDNCGSSITAGPAGWTDYNGPGYDWSWGNGLDTAYLTATATSEAATWTQTSNPWQTIGVVATPGVVHVNAQGLSASFL